MKDTVACRIQTAAVAKVPMDARKYGRRRGGEGELYRGVVAGGGIGGGDAQREAGGVADGHRLQRAVEQIAVILFHTKDKGAAITSIITTVYKIHCAVQKQRIVDIQFQRPATVQIFGMVVDDDGVAPLLELEIVNEVHLTCCRSVVAGRPAYAGIDKIVSCIHYGYGNVFIVSSVV